MQDYNKLAPHHFRQEPKPERIDFPYTEDGEVVGVHEKQYSRAIEEWERKYKEPERPEEFDSTWDDFKALLVLKIDSQKANRWLEYQDKLSYYNYHKVLFEGWDIQINAIGGATRLFKDRAMVTFYDGDFYQLVNHGSRVYQGKCSISLFKLICQENEIEI